MGHDHAHVHADADAAPLARALALIVGFMAVEVAAGVAAGSLALVADAAHMLMDAVALGLGVWAARLAVRPPSGRMTYGYRRAEILSAQVNGLTLLLLGLAIAVESIHRLASPSDVHGGLVVVTAAAGAAVNLVALSQVARANRHSLNVEGSYRHLVTDLYAFAGTAAAGAVIWATGFVRADAIASLAVAGSMLWAAVPLLRRSASILLEAAPQGIDPVQVSDAMVRVDGVAGVHDLHVWEIAPGFPALSAHVLVQPGDDCHAIRRNLEAVLQERFALDHTTLQVDHARAGLLSIRSLRDDRQDR